jgi:hypothetical protein
MSRLARISVLLLVLAAATWSPAASAQDVEPNDTCSEARALGLTTALRTIQGSLDSPAPGTDLDFYRVTPSPGLRFVADFGREVLLAELGEDCRLQAIVGGARFDRLLGTRLAFLVIAAAGDVELASDGDPASEGPYRFALQVPTIGSISGRIVDADTGLPLSGDGPLAARAVLLRCSVDVCSTVNALSADALGVFRFAQDAAGLPLAAGHYSITAIADTYSWGLTPIFRVGEGENVFVDDVRVFAPHFDTERPARE